MAGTGPTWRPRLGDGMAGIPGGCNDGAGLRIDDLGFAGRGLGADDRVPADAVAGEIQGLRVVIHPTEEIVRRLQPDGLVVPEPLVRIGTSCRPQGSLEAILLDVGDT